MTRWTRSRTRSTSRWPGSLAPGAPLYNFYFAGNLLANAVADADVASYFDQDLASALSYNYTSARLGVVSASFGIADLNDSTWDQELQEAAATGVTIVGSERRPGERPRQPHRTERRPVAGLARVRGVQHVGCALGRGHVPRVQRHPGGLAQRDGI